MKIELRIEKNDTGFLEYDSPYIFSIIDYTLKNDKIGSKGHRYYLYDTAIKISEEQMKLISQQFTTILNKFVLNNWSSKSENQHEAV